MEKMEDLRDLLRHEIQDLISAEDQIIEALPLMTKKATNKDLKKALTEHLRVTEKQRKRLDKVQKLMGDAPATEGLFSRLFGSGHTCRGMEGIIEEGQKIMAEDMNNEVMDAAIIAAAQRVEHYEICGYGTAKAYAQELGLGQVASLLEETLKEEYEADRKLTGMAVKKVNIDAEKTGTARGAAARTRSAGRREKSKSNGAPARATVAASRGKAPASRTATAGRKTGSVKKTKAAAPAKAAPRKKAAPARKTR